MKDPSESRFSQRSVREKLILRNMSVDLLETFVLAEHLVVSDELELLQR